MSALSAARLTQSKHRGNIRRYPMKASTTIYAGGMVMLDSNGLALPAAASASNKGVVGVAEKTVTSDGSTTSYIDVVEGTFRFAATTIAQASVGSLCYAEDDQTIDETQGTNEPIAGILVEVESASIGWVAIGLHFLT